MVTKDIAEEWSDGLCSTYTPLYTRTRMRRVTVTRRVRTSESSPQAEMITKLIEEISHNEHKNRGQGVRIK